MDKNDYLYQLERTYFDCALRVRKLRQTYNRELKKLENKYSDEIETLESNNLEDIRKKIREKNI